MKDSRFFGGFADLVSHHPRVTLVLVAVASVWLSFQLPKLTRDPSPRALLLSADPEQAELEVTAQRLFGATDNVVVVVLGHKDVLSREPLSYAHKLAQKLAAMADIERVDALTRVTFPRAAEEEATLDDLDAQPAEEATSPEMLSAAADLVASAPDLFPNGLASLAERTGGKTLGPMVAGEQVTDEDVTFVRDAVAKAPQLTGRLVSKSKKHLVVAANLSSKLVKHDDTERAVHDIESWLEKNPAPSGVSVSLSGLPVVRTSLVRHMRTDQRVLIPGTLIASFLVLLLSFRWAPAVFLPIVAVAITALWLLSGMALFDEPLNVLNNMLPALVIIIGLNEAVHIIGRYMEEYTRLGDKYKALHETVRAMGAACLMTTLTSAIGLAALLVSRTEMLRRFGLVGALGLVLAYVITLLVVPASLSLLPGPKQKLDDELERGVIETAIARITHWALRRSWLVVSLSLLSTLAAGYVSQRVVVDSALLDQFPKSDSIAITTRLLEAEFEGVRPLDVTLTSEQAGRFFEPELLRAAHRISEWASDQHGVLRVSDPTEPLASGWAALSGRPVDVKDALRSKEQLKALSTMLRDRDPRILGPYLTTDGKSIRVRVKLADVGSRATATFADGLTQRIGREFSAYPDVKSAFGGDAYLSSRGLDAVVADLSGSVGLAALVVFALLAVLLRNPRLALLAIPANLLPQVWTMAWMVLRGIPLNASSAIIFSLSIGLSVDGSIHLVSRFQEERARGSMVTTALLRAVRGTGRNIVISSVALVLGFSVMLLSNFVPVQRFAELISVSLAGCVLATLVIQPALLRLFAGRSSSLPVASPQSDVVPGTERR